MFRRRDFVQHPPLIEDAREEITTEQRARLPPRADPGPDLGREDLESRPAHALIGQDVVARSAAEDGPIGWHEGQGLGQG